AAGRPLLTRLPTRISGARKDQPEPEESHGSCGCCGMNRRERVPHSDLRFCTYIFHIFFRRCRRAQHLEAGKGKRDPSGQIKVYHLEIIITSSLSAIILCCLWEDNREKICTLSNTIISISVQFRTVYRPDVGAGLIPGSPFGGVCRRR